MVRRQRRGSRGEEPATERRKWLAKSWGSIMFQQVSIAKKMQESGNRFIRFVMNPCFGFRLFLNFRSQQLPVFSRLPISKFVMRDCFVNSHGVQVVSDINIIICNNELNVFGGSPPLTPAATPAHSLPINGPFGFGFGFDGGLSGSYVDVPVANPCWAVLVYQWYASFYQFIADTILHQERRAIKTEHDELNVSKPVAGDGDETCGPESVREHHRMIQERVSAVISNAPYLLNVDCDSFINNSKAFFEGMYFSMDRKRHDRYSSRNVMLLDKNIKGLDGNQGPPINVGIGCSLGGRPTVDMMPQLRKNPLKKACNGWPKWKVKSIPRKLGNKEDTKQIHALENIEVLGSILKHNWKLDWKTNT